MATQTKDNPINFEILPWETVIQYIRENVQITRSDHWQRLLDARVGRCHRELSRTTVSAENYMKWIRARGKNVKAAPKTIPSSILGPKINESDIIDVRVSCRGPDDKLYDKDEELRRRLPRGCTLIQCQLKDEAKPRLDFVLFALRKFSGGLG